MQKFVLCLFVELLRRTRNYKFSRHTIVLQFGSPALYCSSVKYLGKGAPENLFAQFSSLFILFKLFLFLEIVPTPLSCLSPEVALSWTMVAALDRTSSGDSICTAIFSLNFVSFSRFTHSLCPSIGTRGTSSTRLLDRSETSHGGAGCEIVIFLFFTKNQ